MKVYLIFSIIIAFFLPACQTTPPLPATPTEITALPTETPSPSPEPSIQPTSQPTSEPTIEPTNQPTSQLTFPAEPLPLDAYPRPPEDNGLGIHWSTHLYAQSDEATDYFVNELVEMNIKWVKLLVDGLTNRDYDSTVDKLVANDMMPIIRIYQQCNTPYDSAELEAMVRHYVAKGVYYYDLYNEPNQPGESGGWCEDETSQPDYLAEIWADAARTIYQAGGYPGLPSFFAPNQKEENWHNAFFYQFFEALREQGNEEVLYFSWASIHNYNINHPSTYPYDEVNQTGRLLTPEEIERYGLNPAQAQEMNLNRAIAGILKHRLLTEDDAARFNLSNSEIEEINRKFTAGELMGFNLYDDSTAFLHFVAYRNQFYDLFGFEIPMLSTEGGATNGSSEDPRYPQVDGQTVADWTLWSADYMLDDAPDYYFATSTWLLAQGALDYEEPVWEGNAWYHDRDGDQEPVVAALKNRPRKDEARILCTRSDVCLTQNPISQSPISNLQSPVSLSNYPRPPADNGRGIHWSPTNQRLSEDVVDYFVGELTAMNIKWVKFLQDDQPTVTDPYLIEQLVAHDIEPVMRVYKPFNDPYQHLPELVAEATAMGVDYFELYNEPNVARPAGGWQEGETVHVERIIGLWIMAAVDVHEAGGLPGLPPLAGGGTVDDMVFLGQFLDGVQARGREDLLIGAWIPVHNYFLNHPIDYPTDPVNVDDVLLTDAEIEARKLTPEQVEAINKARRTAKLPREEGGFWVGNTIDKDSNAFRKFDAYAEIFADRFGYYIPIISTEGGATAGAEEDPRYPPVREEDVTTLTLDAYHFMLDEAPGYFFAHTPWLLANSAGEAGDERFENAAWYKDREGTTLPVVEALKDDPRKNEVRQWQEPSLPVED
ncbi:MAG: PT domain-containing protein [Anaerolineae bacterium]|nr:PT domain-containing protein [Anaerolineae bacterium]